MAGVSTSFPVPKHSIGMPQPFLSRLLSVLTILPGEAAALGLPEPRWVSPKFHRNRSAPSCPSSPSPFGTGAAPAPSPQRRVPSPGLAGHQGAASTHYRRANPPEPCQGPGNAGCCRWAPSGRSGPAATAVPCHSSRPTRRLLEHCGHPGRRDPRLRVGQGLAGWVAQLAQPPGTVPRLLRHRGRDSNFHSVAAPSSTSPIRAEPAAPSNTSNTQ